MSRKTILPALMSAGMVLLAVAAFASSEGGGEEHGGAFWGVFWQVVNFGVLVALLVFVGRKPIRDFFRNRSETIKKSLDEARQARELAEKALAEVDERLKTKDREIQEIISTAEQSGRKERDAIIKEGERLSQRLIEQARVNIDYELKQAREAIKAEAVELALELAEKKITGRLSEQEQRKLFEEALGRLEKKA